MIDLPNSKVALTSPRFFLLRPSGGSGLELVEPQIPLHDDPLHPEHAAHELIQLQAAPERLSQCSAKDGHAVAPKD